MKEWKKMALAATGLILALCVSMAVIHRYRNSFVFMEDVRYARTVSELDLSGRPVADMQTLMELKELTLLDLTGTGLTQQQYDTLHAALPDCQILWGIPFQGKTYPEDTQVLAVTTLTAEDVAQLGAFPALRRVDTAGCQDYDQILALQEAYPQLEAPFTVQINGREWTTDTVEMVLTDVDAQELSLRLAYLPEVTNITLEGTLPAAEALKQIREAYPKISFYWQYEVFGIQADVNTAELDLSNIPMEDTAQVEEAVAYLPGLQTVVMCDCGIPNEDMDALNRRYENIKFVWSVNIGPSIRVRTDIIAFMPVKWDVWVSTDDCYNLRYCTDLVCLDLGHMRITNCDFVAYMPHMKYLILADTLITDITPLTGLKELEFLELFLTGVKDYSPLLTCTALEDLNLFYTFGDPEIIAQMTWLKRLWWGNREEKQLPYEVQLMLKECLPNTQLILAAKYSTGYGWRQGENYYEMRDLLGMWYMR